MSAQIRIVHNKKLSMTPEESDTYTNICRAYDRPNFKGDDLFIDLFESDKYGNITFIKSPSRQTSMEVFLFICALYTHQGRRLMELQEQARLKELTEKFEDRLKELTTKFEEKLGKIENQ
jgi:hypothetical protein